MGLLVVLVVLHMYLLYILYIIAIGVNLKLPHTSFISHVTIKASRDSIYPLFYNDCRKERTLPVVSLRKKLLHSEKHLTIFTMHGIDE